MRHLLRYGTDSHPRPLAGEGRGEGGQTIRAVALTFLLSFSAAAQATPPTFTQVLTTYPTTEALLLDRNNQPLHELRIDKSARRLNWVTLKEVSPALIDALIASEDQRFFSHGGVDWQAAVSAMWDNMRSPTGKRPRGASTLTMQVAGLLHDDLAPRAEGRTWTQKWDQAQEALALESAWSKEQILEAYLNLVTFRGELQGIAAASRGLFGKHPAGLDYGEAMLLAALLRSPNATHAQAAQRACGLQKKLEHGPTCEEIKLLAEQKVKPAYQLRSEYSQAPHLARKLLDKSGGRVTTTLDADIQRAALTATQRHLLELNGRSVEDAAVVVLDNATGEVLAYVGSSGALSKAGDIDGVLALRQAGSTLKPFLYGQAIEDRLITAASLIDDAPLNIDTSMGVYTPGNYDGGYKGLTSVRNALASSLNVPAVKTLQLVGPEPFRLKLREFGLDSLTESGDYYGYSLALGSSDVSLLALTNAYRALANGGKWTETTLLPRAGKPTQRKVMDERAAFIVADMLSDAGARALSFGTDSVLATRMWSAVKTGTSKDMRDNWCIGFSARYTVGVWVGNFSGAPMRDVSGVAGAAPIWADVMHALHADMRSERPAAPRGIVRETVTYHPAVEASRAEYFLAGTEQANIRIRNDAALTARITYPTPGLIVALDPDIPEANQRLPIELNLLEGVAAVRIGDVDLPVKSVNYWAPVRGKHRVMLVDAEGMERGEVRFEVR